MEYRFADLVDLPGFQQVMQSWYSVAGVPTALLDTERHVLCAVGWQDICTRFHHLPPQAEDRCPYSDDYIFSRMHAGDYVAHQCEHGLMNSAMPVIVKDEHVATLFMGQFLHAPLDEAFFRRQAQEPGVDERGLPGGAAANPHHRGRATAGDYDGANATGPNVGHVGL
jgi:ligand-binding sensor protein